MTAYQQLETVFSRWTILQDVGGILGWDMETMMPPGSIGSRSEQLAMLEDLRHETLTAPAVADLLAEAEARAGDLDEWQRANLREMRREHVRSVAVPGALVVANAKATSTCQHAWQGARKANDFAAVKPLLAEVVRLQREIGAAIGDATGVAPYDALLDGFEPGSSEAGIDRLFAPLEEALPDLLAAALEAQALSPAPVALPGPFGIERQERLCRTLLERLGFDFTHGRLDVSAHPFSGGAYGDVRVTTRFAEEEFLSAMMATIHEGGHALYEQGRPHEWRNQPVGQARGMGIHESQSMIIELQAGRSEPFVSYLAAAAREVFDGEDEAWRAANIGRLVHRVEPGFIRVESDELTYPAHILIRYRLEKALISGDLAVDDLPDAFNAAVNELLGLTVPDDRRGCLQDIHWYGGAYGYFPMYLKGAMVAAQLFEAAVAATPGILTALGQGDFAQLVGWLRDNVHGRASLTDGDTLVENATGAPPSAAAYLRHLDRRYVGDG